MRRHSLGDRPRCARSRQLHPFATAVHWASARLLLQFMALGWLAHAETGVAWLPAKSPSALILRNCS